MGALWSLKQSSTHISSLSVQESLAETRTPHRAPDPYTRPAFIEQSTSAVQWQLILIKVINHVISPARPESYVYACETDFTVIHSRTQFIRSFSILSFTQFWVCILYEFISCNCYISQFWVYISWFWCCVPIRLLILCTKSMYTFCEEKVHTFEYVAE